MNKYEMKKSKKYAAMARRIIRDRPDLEAVRNSAVKVAYFTSMQEKRTGSGLKAVLGECVKVSQNMQWACPYDFYIVIYEQNCAGFTDEQYEILLWHELKHIGIREDTAEPEYYIVPHDYEEFKEIVQAYGLDWTGDNNAERRQSEQQGQS